MKLLIHYYRECSSHDWWWRKKWGPIKTDHLKLNKNKTKTRTNRKTGKIQNSMHNAGKKYVNDKKDGKETH